MPGKKLPKKASKSLEPTVAYKAVLIVGAGIAPIDETVKAKFQQKGWLLIGDGIKDLKQLDFEILKNKIDANTQIYIDAHGSAYKGAHYLDHSPSKDSSYPTKDLLTKIGGYSKEKQPLNIHLISCYSGTAADNVAVLPPDSMLVTHGVANLPISTDISIKTTQELTKFIPETGDVNFRQNFVDKFSTNTKQTATVSIVRKDGSTWQKTMRPPDAFLTKPEEIIRYLKENRIEITESYNRHFQNLAPALTTDTEITEADAIHWRNDNFIYMISTNDKKLLEVLNRNIGAFKDFINHTAGYNRSALATAAGSNNHEMVTALLKSPDILVNAQDIFGQTALMMAVRKGHEKAVEALLKSGKIDVKALNITDIYGKNALMLAAEHGHQNIEKLLKIQAELEEFKGLWSQVTELGLDKHLDSLKCLVFNRINEMASALDVNDPISFNEMSTNLKFLLTNAPIILKLTDSINELEKKRVSKPPYSTPELNNYLSSFQKQFSKAINAKSPLSLRAAATQLEYLSKNNADIEIVDGLLKTLRTNLNPEDDDYDERDSYIQEATKKLLTCMQQNLPLQELLIDLKLHAPSTNIVSIYKQKLGNTDDGDPNQFTP